MPKFRLVTTTIAVAAVALSLRIGDAWRLAGEAAAQDAGQAASRPKGGAAPAAATPAAPPAPAAAPAAAPAGAAPAAAAAGEIDPTRLINIPFTQTEIDLLQKLSARREALEAREREIDMREGLLKAAERSLEAKSAELEALRKRVEAATRNFRQGEDERINSLVKIYETMKPKEAARIFDELEMPVLIDVLKRMKEAKSAQILASMDPAKARTITGRLAERPTLPNGG